MAQNEIPRSMDQLFTKASDMIDGMKKHQESLGVKQNTHPVIQADLQAARTAGESPSIEEVMALVN